MLRIMILHMDAANSFGTPRSYVMSPQTLKAHETAGLSKPKSAALNCMLAVRREVQNTVRKHTPLTRSIALREIEQIFGFVPKIFNLIPEDDIIGLVTALHLRLLQPDSSNQGEQLLEAATASRVLAISAYSYNCYYLVAVYVYLAARLPHSGGLDKVVDSMRMPVTRIQHYHEYVQRLKDQPGAF